MRKRGAHVTRLYRSIDRNHTVAHVDAVARGRRGGEKYLVCWTQTTRRRALRSVVRARALFRACGSLGSVIVLAMGLSGAALVWCKKIGGVLAWIALCMDRATTAIVVALGEPDTQCGRRVVVVQDYMTAFVALTHVDRTWTLDEVFRRFWDRTTAWLNLDDAEAWVRVCDDRDWVTRYKAETQAKRADDGRKRDARTPERDLSPYAADECADIADMHEFDLRRLKATHHGSMKPLWIALVPLITAEMRRVRPGRVFIFDFCSTIGPLRWESGEDAPPPRRMRAGHRLGEGDPAAIWWLANYDASHRTNIDYHVMSSDGDILPLYALYHEQALARQQRVFMHSDVTRAEGKMIDLGVLVTACVRNSGGLPSARWLALWFILCGNDYVDRGAYATMFSVDDIREALCTLARERVRTSAEKASGVGEAPPDRPLLVDTLTTTRELFVAFLRRLYHTKHTAGTNKVPAKKRKPLAFTKLREVRLAYPPLAPGAPRRKVFFPPDDVIDDQARRVEFSLLYWGNAAQGWRPDLDASTNVYHPTAKAKATAG